MGLISIATANCKNCYRCLRYCPVKAISIKNHQARIEEKLCINCGACISQCPQNAKRVKSSIPEVKDLLLSGHRVIASIAPSYGAAFPIPFRELAQSLQAKGFFLVEETAVGAERVAEEYRRLFARIREEECVITSPCSVVVSYIQKYFPTLVNSLAPIVSPMVAHGTILKERFGPDVKVVFIGPCIGKKEEAMDPVVSGIIDAVMTFAELPELLGLDLPGPREDTGSLPLPDQPDLGRWFPLPGGLLKTAGLSTAIINREILIVDGLEEVKEVLTSLQNKEEWRVRPKLIEMLACKGGCVGGPAMPAEKDLYVRIMNIIERNSRPVRMHLTPVKVPGYERRFAARAVKPVYPGEEKIREALAAMGKTSPDKELNCGSCGYPTCRDKAIAICLGMAEPEMCVPRMREKAENLANIIIESLPNGVVVVDGRLIVREFNPAAEAMFKVRAEDIKGKPLRTLIPDHPYAEVLARKGCLQTKQAYPEYSLVTHQTISYVEDEDLILAIIVDITAAEREKANIERVRRETLEKAQEVINKQMRVAQEIAGLLGETTAESKVLLTRLIELVREGEN